MINKIKAAIREAWVAASKELWNGNDDKQQLKSASSTNSNSISNL